MKFFSNKIRIKADFEEKQNPITPHSNPEINPWHDEESPQDFSFSNEHPAKIKHVQGNNLLAESGMTGALFHYDKNGKKTGIAKSGANDPPLNEAAYYNIGKELYPDIVIPTVMRKHKDFIGRPNIHSVQQYVKPHDDFIKDKGFLKSKHSQNPDLMKIGLMDYLLNHADRHYANFMMDENNRIRPIDNSGLFDNEYHKDCPALKYVHGQLPISDDIKLPILNYNKEKLKKHLDKLPHLDELQEEYAQQHLANLQQHFKNLKVKTANDLFDKLYPEYKDNFHHPAWVKG